MNRIAYILAFLILPVIALADENVMFTSEHLEKIIASDLGVYPPIQKTDLLRLEVLNLDELVGSLEGLQYAKNLRVLRIYGNCIENIDPLVELKQLQELVFAGSRTAGGSGKKDISSFSKLTNLKYLKLAWNAIENANSLAALSNLVVLDLSYNMIQDVAPLSKLPSLRYLNIVGNPFLEHQAGKQASVLLQANPSLKINSLCSNPSQGLDGSIYFYESVIVDFCNFARFEILPDSKTPVLPNVPFEVADSIKTLEGKQDRSYKSDLAVMLCNYATLIERYYPEAKCLLSKEPLVQSMLVGLNAGDLLDALSKGESSNGSSTPRILVKWIEEHKEILGLSSGLDTAIERYNQVVLARDQKGKIEGGLLKNLPLERAVCQELKIMRPLAESDLLSLRTLCLTDSAMKTLEGLQQAKNLRVLRIYGCPIEDLSPLATLTGLQEVLIQGIKVKDLSALTKLSQLRYLVLAGNAIESVNPLNNLQELQWLDVSENKISDIAPLQKLSKLNRLRLYENPVISRLDKNTFDTQMNQGLMVEYEPASAYVKVAERLSNEAAMALFCLHSRTVFVSNFTSPIILLPEYEKQLMEKLRIKNNPFWSTDLAALQLEYCELVNRDGWATFLVSREYVPSMKILLTGDEKGLWFGQEGTDYNTLGQWLCKHRPEYGPSIRFDDAVKEYNKYVKIKKEKYSKK